MFCLSSKPRSLPGPLKVIELSTYFRLIARSKRGRGWVERLPVSHAHRVSISHDVLEHCTLSMMHERSVLGMNADG